MSEKNLTEAEWKKFSKGRDFKDSALLKALAGLDKATDPERELEALADLEKQADLIRKAYKADKELVSYLDVLDKSLDKQRKLADAEVKKAKAKESDEEDEESSALLTSKMVPLLRQVRKGEEMQALVGSLGKDVAVMLSRRAISPARRKLIADYIGGGAPKFYAGTCVFEENAYTFVLKTQAGGLAKKVKAALLKQVELRLKVRVRGEDPNDIDDDGDVAGEDEGAPSAAAAAPTATAAPAAAAAAPVPAEDPLKATYDTRMAELQPRVIALIQAQAGDAGKLRAVAEFVREKGDAGQYKAALQGMDSLVKLVAAASQTLATHAAEAKADPAVATVAFTARLGLLKPRIQEALAAADERAGLVKAKVAEAGGLAAKKSFDDANRAVDELEALLGHGGAAAAPTAARPAAPASSAGAEYTALRERLEPGYLSLMSGRIDPSLADQFGAVTRAWDMAHDSMEAGDADRALLILKRLADGGALETLRKAHQAGAATAGRPAAKAGPSLVEQRKFMLTRWARIPSEIKTELDSLRQVIVDQDLDEDPDELVEAIDDHLQDLFDDLQGRLDTAVNTGDHSAFKGLRQQVENDSIIGHLLKAPFMDGSKFKQTTLAAIDEIEAALA